MKKCPACGVDAPPAYTSGTKNFLQHIRAQAKAEIFKKALLETNKITPHFNYIKKNMLIIPKTKLTFKL